MFRTERSTVQVQVSVTVPLTAAGRAWRGRYGADGHIYDSAPEVTAAMSSKIATTVSPATGARYVAPTGSDGKNNCLLASEPCQSINYAADAAQSGDEVKLAAGTYTNPNIAAEATAVGR